MMASDTYQVATRDSEIAGTDIHGGSPGRHPYRPTLRTNSWCLQASGNARGPCWRRMWPDACPGGPGGPHRRRVAGLRAARLPSIYYPARHRLAAAPFSTLRPLAAPRSPHLPNSVPSCSGTRTRAGPGASFPGLERSEDSAWVGRWLSETAGESFKDQHVMRLNTLWFSF